MSWRDTLFCWRGTVVGLKWNGAWVGTESGADPVDEDFLEAETTFEASRVAGKDSKNEGTRVSGTWVSSYRLDNSGTGEDFATYSDPEYTLLETAESVPEEKTRVVGRGSNEFGAFVINGERNGEMLLLRRRYIEEEDARAGKTLDELMSMNGNDVVATTWTESNKKAKSQ